MRQGIYIKEDIIETVVGVNTQIIEFEGQYDKAYFENRYQDRDRLILVGYFNDKPVGYLLAYDRDNDKSFYCWLAGVDPEFRKLGILTELMKYLNTWALSHGYKKIKIKTRNCRREMIAFLVKNDFNFVGVEEKGEVNDYRILLEKKI